MYEWYPNKTQGFGCKILAMRFYDETLDVF